VGVNIIVTTKNLYGDSQGSLEAFVNEKVGKLKKFLKTFGGDRQPPTDGKDTFETFVEVERETRHHKKGDIFHTEIKLSMPGAVLFAKAHGENIHQTVVEAVEEVEREIKKYKTKTIDMPRRKQQKSKKSF